MANIIQLEAAQEQFLSELFGDDNPVSDEQLALLEEHGEKIANKIDGFGYFVNNFNAETEGIKQFIKILQEKVRARENKLTRIKEFFGRAVNIFGVPDKNGIKKIKGFVITIKDATKEIPVYDAERIPGEFKETSLVVKLPYEKYFQFMDKPSTAVAKFLSEYGKDPKHTVDENRLTKDVEGVGFQKVPNITIYGLKKLQANKTNEGE